MSRGLCHLVLTRFNVYYEDRGPATDEWLHHRFGLFCRYTLPSMRSQTVQPDRWLIVCHDGSPDWFRQQLIDVLSDVPAYEPIWMAGHWDPDAGARLVKERVPRDATQLLTTLLDNDDAVARDFLKSIRAHCHGQAWELLNLTKGSQAANGKLYLRSDPANPFISLLEDITDDSPRTAFLDWHNRLPNHGPVRQIHTHPMWVQIVHDRNMANRVHGIRTSADVIARHFDVDLGIQPVTRTELLADRIRTSLALSLRVVQKPHRIMWALRVLRPSRDKRNRLSS
jgi:Putative rhamnosyl transferase